MPAPPSVRRYLDLSTIHLDAASTAFLDRPAPVVRGSADHPFYEAGGQSLFCVPHSYGWWLFAHDEFGGPDGGEVPAVLARLCQFALQHDCTWINLDADGDVVDELPRFDLAADCAVQPAVPEGDPAMMEL